MCDKPELSKMKKEEEQEKFLYERAIEGRQHHQQNFNHWMNMYAIFNGALFAGYYNIDEKTSLFAVLLLCLGCVAGWAWHFSSVGFYDWILSWINIVRKHEIRLDFIMREGKLNEHPKKAVVYRYYDQKKTISTQKLTKCFTGAVAVAWTVLVAKVLSWHLKQKFNLYCCDRLFFFFIVVALIFLCASLLYCVSLESDFEAEDFD